MVSYMSNPQHQVIVTHGGTSTTYTSIFSSINTRHVENGFDQAGLTFADTDSNFYVNIVAGDTVEVQVKDASDVSPTTIFKGRTYLSKPTLSPIGEQTVLQCDGRGYIVDGMVCADEYGSQSFNPLVNTIKTIIENGTVGLKDNWIKKILGGGSSGHTTITSQVETIDGSIRYYIAQYKPCSKVLNDICDLVTALKAGNAGPHWIVDTSDRLLVATVGNHGAPASTYWPTWLNNTTNVTLTQGIDFTDFNFEKQDLEANYILYIGNWMWPVHDYLTEDGVANNLWATVTGGGAGITLSDDPTCVVGDNSLKAVGTAAAAAHRYYHPASGTLGLSASNFGGERVPGEINFYIKEDNNGTPQKCDIRIVDTLTTKYFYYNLLPVADMGLVGNWVHVTLPLGPYFPKERYPGFTGWSQTAAPNAPSWNNINYIEFAIQPGAGGGATIDVYLDDLYLSGRVIRGAKDADSVSTNGCKMKVVTDNVAKDDTCKSGSPGTTDLGTLAQLAYAELLRSVSTPLIGQITLPMLKDALPGQKVLVNAKKKSDGTYGINATAFRIITVRHNISTAGFFTTLELTDDLTNSRARMAFEDANRVIQAVHPNFQDRQATSIKLPEIDITQNVLEESY